MGKVIVCPECGKLVALRFPLHDCVVPFFGKKEDDEGSTSDEVLRRTEVPGPLVQERFAHDRTDA